MGHSEDWDAQLTMWVGEGRRVKAPSVRTERKLAEDPTAGDPHRTNYCRKLQTCTGSKSQTEQPQTKCKRPLLLENK